MPKLPKRSVLSPVEAQFRQALKSRLFDYCAGDWQKLARVLVETPKYASISLVGKLFEITGGAIGPVLMKLGVKLEMKGRHIRFSDAQGQFEFIDDFYYSGLRALLSSAEDLLCYEFEFPPALRASSALRVCGMVGDDKEMLSQLVSKRKDGSYRDIKRVRMLGSDLKFRPLVFGRFVEVAKRLRVTVYDRFGQKYHKYDPTSLVLKSKKDFKTRDLKWIVSAEILEASRRLFETAVSARVANEVKERLKVEAKSGRLVGYDGLLVTLLGIDALTNSTMLVGFILRHKDFLRGLERTWKERGSLAGKELKN